MSTPLLGQALAHESAALHVSGRAQYVDDLPELAGTLHAAYGLSACAHGRVTRLQLEAVRAAPGVVAVITAADIPGSNNCGPVLHDEPILASDELQFYGQPVFLVVAQTRAAARRAAGLAQIDYAPLPAILDVAAATAAAHYVLPPVLLERGDAAAALAAAPQRLQGSAELGGQEHFYLEGQVSYAVPREDAAMHVYCSTQHPTEMQHMVAWALGWAVHQVSVECRRIGGGFGGKESQSAQHACAAAVAAWLTGRPVKLRLDRDEDMTITGKRHDFRIRWDVGFDARGRILGLALELASRCGFSADLSGPVNDRAVFSADNAYYLDAVSIRSLRTKTHTVSNTAFRGFGGPQGMFAIEYILDDIARHLGLDALAVRQANFYDLATPAQSPPLLPRQGARHTTHYGMVVEDNIAPLLVEQLARDCRYAERRAEIAQFNASSPLIKRGLALSPVKFGISFTATLFNQASALVHVYADGSVLFSHGGVEMGQGLHTKLQQIVADEFGLARSAVRFTATDTSRVPNTSATAASSATDLNGMAVLIAARAVRQRLSQFIAEREQVAPESVVFAGGRVRAGTVELDFGELSLAAYRARIKLWESGFYRTPKIHYDAKTMRGRPFYYFAYGAACSEVALDTLSGEARVLRVDILHELGRSLNPAIDIGQIEGGFMQGLGWLTSEELWWREDGRLMTHAPSTYKIPTAADVPEVFNVHLFTEPNREDTVHQSKAVGEPPLMLALSAFFALRDACSATGHPALRAPATPEALLRALGGLT